jgi:hypothetical protein
MVGGFTPEATYTEFVTGMLWRGILAKSPSSRYSGLPHVTVKGTSTQSDMIAPRPCLAQLSRLCTSSNARLRVVPSLTVFQPRFLAPYATAVKNPSARGQNPQKNKKKGEASKKKRKPKTTYTQYDLKDTEQFSLCDAMRYAEERLNILEAPLI